MAEPNFSVFRACAAWKHPTCGKDQKQRIDKLTGLFTCTGISGAQKRDHSHSWHTFALCRAFISTLWWQSTCSPGELGLCYLSALGGFPRFGGFRTQSLCFYQGPVADLPPNPKGIFQESNCTVDWARPTIIVGGMGVWQRKMQRKWIQGKNCIS